MDEIWNAVLAWLGANVLELLTAAAAVSALFVSLRSIAVSRDVPKEVQKMQGEQTNEQWLRDKRLAIYIELIGIHAEIGPLLIKMDEKYDDRNFISAGETHVQRALQTSRNLASQVFLVGSLEVKWLVKRFHLALDTARLSVATSEFEVDNETFQAVAFELNEAMSADVGAPIFGTEEHHDEVNSYLRSVIEKSVADRLANNKAVQSAKLSSIIQDAETES